MPWSDNWAIDKLAAGAVSAEALRVGAGDRRYIDVPDSLGINGDVLQVLAPGGARFDLLPDNDSFPGAGATVIAVYLQVGGVGGDPNDTAFIGQGDILIGTPFTAALPGTYAFEITTQQGAAQVGRLMATGLMSQ